MAKTTKAVPTRPYPSEFGSHTSMVVADLGTTYVVCKDQFGEYTTEKCRLDNGLADPNRYRGSRVKVEK